MDGRILNATVSVGVTTAEPLSTVESMMLLADGALYRAKQQGRNRVECADPVWACAAASISEIARGSGGRNDRASRN
jgi:hypothetical protein